jgi:predicted dehydrogenase
MSQHIVIVGTGSVGKRHARNLSDLGCTVSCVDPRKDRLDEIAGEGVTLKSVFTSLEEAFAAEDTFDAVVVASPPIFHVDQSISALRRGKPVLLEKPVSPDLSSGLKLQSAVHDTKVPLLLGYTWRWWPPLLKVKDLVARQAVGQLRHVKFTMSAHLADWHPWERYQDFFMASEALGGGALLDESHWLDLMLWFFGVPEKLFAKIEKISDLEIETDDNVDMLVIQFVGENGTLIWEPNRIKLGKGMDPDWEIEEFDYDRNDMFVEVAKEFLHVLSGGSVTTCTIDDGARVLNLIEAARMSSSNEKVIEIDKV